MSGGRKARKASKALQAALNELLVADFCDDYHCAGDCGQPHSEQERQEMIRGTKLDHGAIVYMQKPCEFQRSKTALGGWFCERCGTGTAFDAEGNQCQGYFVELPA